MVDALKMGVRPAKSGRGGRGGRRGGSRSRERCGRGGRVPEHVREGRIAKHRREEKRRVLQGIEEEDVLDLIGGMTLFEGVE